MKMSGLIYEDETYAIKGPKCESVVVYLIVKNKKEDENG